MPTPVQNIQTAYENFASKLAEASVNPKPTYSIDGISVSWTEYLRFLKEGVQGAAELLALLNTGESVNRGRPV